MIISFGNTYKFCDRGINIFILLLKKGIYPYGYMDSLEKFDEELLPEKEELHSNLNLKHNHDVDYRHAKKVLKNFNNKRY